MDYAKAIELMREAAVKLQPKFFGSPFFAYPRIMLDFDRQKSLSLSFHESDCDHLFEGYNHALSWSPEEGEDKLRERVEKVYDSIKICYRVVDESMSNSDRFYREQESYETIKDAKAELFEIVQRALDDSTNTIYNKKSNRPYREVMGSDFPKKVIVLDRHIGHYAQSRVPIYSLNCHSDYDSILEPNE